MREGEGGRCETGGERGVRQGVREGEGGEGGVRQGVREGEGGRCETSSGNINSPGTVWREW